MQVQEDVRIGLFDKYTALIDRLDPVRYVGVVKKCTASMIISEGPQASIGELCEILSLRTGEKYLAEVIAFEDNEVKLFPYQSVSHIEKGSLVAALGRPLSIPASEELCGRVIDSLGRPIDGKGPLRVARHISVFNRRPHVLTRKPINERILTGVKAVDFFTPLGKGQRIGLFAGSGVGKSTLMGMMAKDSSADVNVIALIGERGREVSEFINDALGEEGMKRSVVVVSDSSDTPLSRFRGAYTATAIAEFFRDRGKDVMLYFDSVTRLAMAIREIGLASGEVAASRGYTPNVFSSLQELLERCSTSDKGTITGIYTVLVEGGDFDEPITDCVRAIIDGHIILDRKLAERGQYPAIDVLASLSRLENAVASRPQRQAAAKIRSLISVYRERKDLIDVGAYSRGTDWLTDEAIDKIDGINRFLSQDVDESVSFESICREAAALTGTEITA